jgi:hypothetical protein
VRLIKHIVYSLTKKINIYLKKFKKLILGMGHGPEPMSGSALANKYIPIDI